MPTNKHDKEVAKQVIVNGEPEAPIKKVKLPHRVDWQSIAAKKQADADAEAEREEQ